MSELGGAQLGGVQVGSAFSRRVLVRTSLVAFVAFMTVALLAPWSLMLESQNLAELWLICLEVGLGGLALIMLLTWLRLRRASRVVHALTLEAERVDPEEVGELADLPFAITGRFVAVGAVAATLTALPQVRPAHLDDARGLSLALLMFTIISASAIVCYVAIRDATMRAIELSPVELVTAWLERDALRAEPTKRVVRRILLAVVVPVALVGVGAVLVAHAHLLAFVEQSRNDTAVQVVRAALDPVAGLKESGQEDAVAAAAAHGFTVQHAVHEGDERSGETATQRRLASGQLVTDLELTYGEASVRYSARLASEAVTSGVWLAVLAGLLAALLGGAFGRMLAADLMLATQQVSSLGTDTVLRGKARVAGPARFSVVGELGGSVEALAERFRVFAAAQERALEAKSTSRRMKQLLFASVSHDLKSPLNAILGFAELVRDEHLSPTQVESLDMVVGRGRELLVLIETILDAARVEAGQLQLMPAPIDADELVADALAKARDLAGTAKTEVVVEMARGMPRLFVDAAYAGRAVAVLIAHAIDSAGGARARALRLRGSLPARERYEGGTLARLDIEYVAALNRPSLLEAQLAGKIPDSSGRGMVLRLSLARAIIELHHGHVEVGRGPHGAAVVTCWLPITSESFAMEELPTRVMRDKREPPDSQASIATMVLKKPSS